MAFDVVIRAERNSRSVTLSILDPAGLPTPTPVGVTLGPAGIEKNYVADAKGTLVVSGLYSDSTPARIGRAGCVTKVIPNLSLTEPTQTITLQPGRTVKVAFVDGQDSPVRVEYVRGVITATGVSIRVRRLRLGVHELSELPPGEVEIHFKHDGQRHKLTRDTGQPEIQIIVE